MRIYLTCFLFLSCIFTSKSQDSIQLYKPAGNISLFIGDGIPIGSYGSNKGTDYGDFALHGIAWGFSAGLPIKHSHWGVAIVGLMYNNSFNQDSLGYNILHGFINTHPQAAIYPYYPLPITRYYSGLIIMTGGIYSAHLNDFSFEFRILTGYGIFSFPELEYGYSINGSNEESYDIAASNSGGLVIDGGIKTQLYFSKSNLGIELNIDFFYADPLLNTSETYTNPPGMTSVSPNSTTQIKNHIPISQVIATIGVCYRFIK